MIGAIVSGKIADYAGRRVAMGFSEVFCILGSLIIAFSKDARWLCIGRLLIGCGISLISYVVPVYIAEIAPKNLRGAFTEVHQFMGCCGFVINLPYWSIFELEDFGFDWNYPVSFAASDSSLYP
ncbi:hypothetical protein AAZX31_19G224300 [Glycine max]|nr:hypothetical protein GLYMA_19G238732v4 [Glycine max]KAH1079303.1 hypothetical protein GYH30_054048 [Glycine max]